MIERFNFYDIYGYLLPGFTWLILLALPFHVIFHFTTTSIPELTAVLAVAYVVGHLLGGFARGFLPSESHDIGLKNKKGQTVLVQRSVAVLSDQYPYRDKVQDGVKRQLRNAFLERFKIDPLNPAEPFDADLIRRMFYLCRSALAQSKSASYVEQYQGMSSLTRSVAFATWTTAAYYAAWATVSTVTQRAAHPGRWLVPVIVLLAGAAAARIVRWAIDRESKGKMPMVRFKLKHVESAVMTGVLVMAASAAAWWYPLSHRASIAFAAGAGLLWIATMRFRSASDAFAGPWIQAIYEDFIVLQTTPKSDKGDADEKKGKKP